MEPTMTRTYIPIKDALKTLASAGHEVTKISSKQARVAGFGGPQYLVDGKRYGLSGIRHLVAELGIEKSTKAAADKPRREIEDIADAIAQSEFCQSKQIVVSRFGYRNLNGQVVYTLHFVNKDGEKKACAKTLGWIRDYCKRNGVI
mgnify:CR=1 FL=1|tara:strand:- start:667 stop:1104 length:438 start_codon:yes stop_codon:yes gene_type:complete